MYICSYPETGRSLRYFITNVVKLADGTFTSSMEHPLKKFGGIFSTELLVRLLCLKYDFNLPENRQIRLLAREGIHISNTTLNSYIHNGISRLREFMEDVFKEFVQQAKYLMVDKTTKLVGVETPEGKAYRRKYLWTFFAKMSGWFIIITITVAEPLM